MLPLFSVAPLPFARGCHLSDRQAIKTAAKGLPGNSGRSCLGWFGLGPSEPASWLAVFPCKARASMQCSIPVAAPYSILFQVAVSSSALLVHSITCVALLKKLSQGRDGRLGNRLTRSLLMDPFCPKTTDSRDVSMPKQAFSGGGSFKLLTTDWELRSLEQQRAANTVLRPDRQLLTRAGVTGKTPAEHNLQTYSRHLQGTMP